MSMDNSGKIVWAKHNEIQTVNAKAIGNLVLKSYVDPFFFMTLTHLLFFHCQQDPQLLMGRDSLWPLKNSVAVRFIHSL